MGDGQGLRDLEELAAKGSSTAKIVLGASYESSPLADAAKAEAWYRAAYQSRPTEPATFRLARFLYRQGRREEAKALLVEGAANGYGLCMHLLAAVYLEENPRERKAEIRRLLEQASEQGYIVAKRRLAVELMRGHYGLSNVPLGVVQFLGIPMQVVRIASRNINDPRLYRE
jgi:hypothetical protein